MAKSRSRSKQLIQLRAGDRFTFSDATWVVTDYDVSVVDGYKEKQWTIQDERTRLSAYLLLCQEKEEGRVLEKWIFSRPVPMGNLSADLQNGSTLDDGMPATAPKQMFYGTEPYAFFESYTVQAEDDEGLMVPRETWDYYDATGVQNLALEIWHEEDKDYPEAYLGVYTVPEEIVYLGFRKIVSPQIFGETLVISFFLLPFLLPFMPAFDRVISVLVPLCVLVLLFRITGLVSLMVACLSAGVIAALLIFLFSANGIFLMVVGVLMAIFLPRIAQVFKDDWEISFPGTAGVAAFLSFWIYGFWMYFRFAPGPHNGGQILAVCGLSLVLGVVAALINIGWTRYGETQH